MTQYRLLLLLVGISVLQSCAASSNSERILERRFGNLDDGREVRIFLLRNAQGTEVEIMDLGAIIVSLNTADAHGNISDITLGYDEPQQYLEANAYMGAVVGRYGNRIAEGRFSIDGQDYTLVSNNGPNALHGGIVGFDKKMWKTSTHSDNSSATISLDLISEDGEEGYPGKLATNVTYTLTDGNRLIIDYLATTDKATVINLTQHAYFNLDGHDAGSVLEHEVLINADQFTPADVQSIPTGEITSVTGTPFDFRIAKKIGQDIESNHEQIVFGSGFDHNFVLNKTVGSEFGFAASAYSARTGRTLTVSTDQPGMQFYTGNFMNGRVIGKGGADYQRRNAFCFETQHYPDSPNKANFPTTVLRPGELYATQTIFKFGIRN